MGPGPVQDIWPRLPKFRGGSHLTLTNVGQMRLDQEFQRFTDSSRASLVAQIVKNLPAMQEIQVQSLG